MKTTTIGRIGAIVTGAAMLGTAVASALAGAITVDQGLTKGFFFDDNMNPKVQVVVGEKAAASDGVAAGRIAALIGNLAFAPTTVKAADGTAEAPAQTVPCTAGAVECTPGSANVEGQVKLSWEAIGTVGELQQRQMDCNIYNTSAGMLMTSLDDGGDSGTFCSGQEWKAVTDPSHYNEIYGPDDTVGTKLVGVCETGTGAATSLLRDGEYENNICTICYNFCDIALGCPPHHMSEWVEIACDRMNMIYDCDDETLKLRVDDNAVKYNIFTDDILTEDIEDGSNPAKLVGQSYLGTILLGQHEYLVEDLDDDSITIVCGKQGTATTSAPMEYIAPKPGSACDAADSDQKYSIKLVGAQTIEEKGVVDVTVEVKRPDNTVEQVTTGISGTPVVGDLKIKLQRGTAASNVITGEQSFSADLLVWYVPSEYKFEDDERYTEEGVKNPRGIWKLKFNSGKDIKVSDVNALEENEELYPGYEMPDDIEENNHWEDCLEDANDDGQNASVIRWLEFGLQRESNETELPEGELIQLPFNDGMYLLSNLKFGYQGLMNEDFLTVTDDLIKTTQISMQLDRTVVYNDTGNDFDDIELYRQVTVDYVDQWGDDIQGARLDEGPFEEGDLVLVCDKLYRIDSIEWNSSKEAIIVEYSVKDGHDWTEYQKESENDKGDALLFDHQTSDGGLVLSALKSETINFGDGWGRTGPDGDSYWFIQTLDSDDEDDWYLWIDKDNDSVWAMAETCNTNDYPGPYCVGTYGCSDDSMVETEFENDVWFCAADSVVLIKGGSGTGAEDEVAVNFLEASKQPWTNNTNESQVYLGNGNCQPCSMKNSDCRKIARGDNDGTLVSLSGAVVEVSGDEIEEPEDSDHTADVVTAVTVTIPEDELRPTIFFGTESALNTSEITITKADVGTVVDIGGVNVTVEEFGVKGSVTGGGAVSPGGQVTVTCPAQSVTCPGQSVNTIKRVDVSGYQLVVVDTAAGGGNLVLIGGPSVNTLTKGLVTVDDLCGGTAEAQVKLSGNKLLVAGCNAADTEAAASALLNWLKTNIV